MSRKPTGCILYEGASLLTGDPIVAIATWSSKNSKTGAMIQTWIMPQNSAPRDAIVTGEDESVCGNCPLRPLKAKGVKCYNVKHPTWLGPNVVWKTYKEGKYPKLDSKLKTNFRALAVRVGSWGDPAAVPREVWDSILKPSRVHTGYTHQWRKFSAFKDILMASVDSLEEAKQASKAGWRYFRVAYSDREDFRAKGEARCPASKEAGRLLTCEQCQMCNGNGHKGKGIVVRAH